MNTSTWICIIINIIFTAVSWISSDLSIFDFKWRITVVYNRVTCIKVIICKLGFFLNIYGIIVNISLYKRKIGKKYIELSFLSFLFSTRNPYLFRNYSSFRFFRFKKSLIKLKSKKEIIEVKIKVNCKISEMVLFN